MLLVGGTTSHPHYPKLAAVCVHPWWLSSRGIGKAERLSWKTWELGHGWELARLLASSGGESIRDTISWGLPNVSTRPGLPEETGNKLTHNARGIEFKYKSHRIEPDKWYQMTDRGDETVKRKQLERICSCFDELAGKFWYFTLWRYFTENLIQTSILQMRKQRLKEMQRMESIL